MATQYSNARAEFRKNNPGVNITQRSWSNYAGKKPVKNWVGSSMYEDSPIYSRNATSSLEDAVEEDDARPSRKAQRRKNAKNSSSSLSESMSKFQRDSATSKKSGETSSSGETSASFGFSQTDKNSMLPRGYSLNEKGQVENTAGYVEPDEWYTTDEATGLKRRKNLQERPVYDGGRVY